MANPRAICVGAGRSPARGNQHQNRNQSNPHQDGNQQNQLINNLTLEPVEALAADPVLIQILTQIQQLMQRSHHQPKSTDKCGMLP